MKQIRSCIKNQLGLTEFINENIDSTENDRIDEGWRDFVNTLKSKFKQVFDYLKGAVVKLGSYFIPVNAAGELLPCVSPLTAGLAYKDGNINKSSTLVVMDKEGRKITGCKGNLKDGFKLYGTGNSIKYWELGFRYIKENQEPTPEGFESINEVKMHTEDPEAKYNIICDNDELQDEIEYHLNNPKDAKLLIWGAPGIGKTAILMNIIKRMQKKYPDYKMIMKTLSNETPDNFTLPKYIEIDEQDFATDVPKTWLPVYKPTGDKTKDMELDQKCGRGLLFIDELSRATPQVLNVVLPLVNEGVFNGYMLGSNWTIICASNRAEDEMSGQASIGNALANRFDQIYYEPTVHTWKKWAEQQKFMSPLLLQWLSMPESENMSGGKFFYMDPNEDMEALAPTTLMCTPRSWTNAMRKLATYSHTGNLEGFTIFDIPERIIGRVLNGLVPASAVDSFLAFLSVIKKIGDFDLAVNEVWSNNGSGFKIAKKDLQLVTLPLAQLVCTAHANELPTTEEFESLAKWLVSTGSDQLASYVLDIFQNIFFAGVPDDNRSALFNIHRGKEGIIRFAANHGQTLTPEEVDSRWKNYHKPLYKAFEAKWGVDIDSEEMPHYEVGLRLISKKFKNAFKDALVDGHEALG